MKKWIFAAVLFLPLFAHAQPLKRAAEASAKKAAAALKQSERRLQAVNRAVRSAPELESALERLYAPLKPAAVNPSAGQFAFAAASNRTAAAERIVRESQFRFFRARAREVKEAVSVLPFKSAAQAASRVPPDARHVFFGVSRQSDAARRFVLDAVKDYAALHPGKKIILLTEYAPDEYPRFVTLFPERGVYKDFARTFVRLRAEGVEIAGLEDPAALQLTREADGAVAPVAGGVKDALYYQGNLLVRASASAQGLRMRAAHWAERIKAWRAQYPDAVFFVYADERQLGYDAAFSVPNLLGRQGAYVTLLRPEESLRHSFFHRLTDFAFAKPGVLRLTDKRWAYRAGFDEQIIFPN